MEVDQINSSSLVDKPAGEDQDSEVEEERLEEMKSKFQLTIDFDESKIPAGATIMCVTTPCPQALMRIIFDDSLTEIGNVKASEKDFKEPKDVLKIYTIENFVFLFVNDDMKSNYVGQIICKIWPTLKSQNSTIVGLSQVYKTNYTDYDGGAISIDSSEALPLRYQKSTHANAAIDGFLANVASMKLDVKPDTQFGANGGLIAALLMHAEMYGLGAITFKGIMDEHVITTEGLKAYAPIVIGLMGKANVKMDELFSYKTFRPVLKELNAKSHGIFN